MPKIYEVSNESNSAECKGLIVYDEFLPLVVLNKEALLDKHKSIDEPKSTAGIELNEAINLILEEDNKVYTIKHELDELTIPILVKKGLDSMFYDENGTLDVAWEEEVEGISFEKESFDATIGTGLDIKITKTAPKLDKEVELLFLAKDNATDGDNQGELEDVLCGRIKVKFGPKTIKYETLKVKIVDCRSNKVVTGCKVEKIALEGAYNITTDFNAESFNKSSGEANDSNLTKQSQQALAGLGFDTKGTGNTYGDNGRKAYNAYWQSRFPELVEKGVIEKIEAGNPPDEMLKFIVEEYNSNFITDEEGVVNLKIPAYLLEKETKMEISFISAYIKEGDHSYSLKQEYSLQEVEDNNLTIEVYKLKEIFGCVKYSSNYGPCYYGNKSLDEYGKWQKLIDDGTITQEQKEIMVGMSENEGNLDAIQSYDSEALTAGAMQKTVNSSGAGEFYTQVNEFKTSSSQKYTELFESKGWTVSGGKFHFKSVLKDAKVTGSDLKTLIRSGFNELTYKKKLGCEPLENLLDAMNDETFQAKQIEDFITRLNKVLGFKPTSYTYKLSDYLHSKLGKALVLDHHVNRPAYVKPDFAASLNHFFSEKDKEVEEYNKGKSKDKQKAKISRNPSDWGTNHSAYETTILEHYGPNRRGTDMAGRYNKLTGKF